MTIFQVGAYVDRGQVEKQTLAHIEEWFIPYLADVERKQTPPLTPRTLAQPRSYNVVTEFTPFPEEQLPFIAVISPGLMPGRKPHIDGDGMVKAWWQVAVGALVSANNERAAKDLAGFYGVALRLLMTQMPQLGGWASGVEWMDEKYDDFPRVRELTRAAVRHVFVIEVQDVMNVRQGPRDLDGVFTPPADPYAVPDDYPEITHVSTVNISVTKEP